jgi:hypothetical protein
MATRKLTTHKTNGAFQTAMDATEDIRHRFEQRIDDVRSRFQHFEKDWSKTVNTLVSRGRSAEKDLRKRLDKVARDLNKSPLVKAVTKSDIVERVQRLDYEKVVHQLRNDVKGVQSEVVDFFQASATRLKDVIDLPSRADFERLNKKIQGLSSQVKSLESKKSHRA